MTLTIKKTAPPTSTSRNTPPGVRVWRLGCVRVCVGVCGCVCVRVKERESERVSERERECACVCV